ncbi:MAG: hypothetical protein IT416_03615 [Candidatus Pacebacteria bacterium]|nr:hypothetical protein [Candidatus Paceibacterota bacterium]
MGEINLHDIGIAVGAKKKFDEIVERAEQRVGVNELFSGEGKKIEAPSTNQLINALVQRIEQYEKDKTWNQVEFDGTKTIIEKKLAVPTGLTTTDIEVLHQLQQRVNLLSDSSAP